MSLNAVLSCQSAHLSHSLTRPREWHHHISSGSSVSSCGNAMVRCGNTRTTATATTTTTTERITYTNGSLLTAGRLALKSSLSCSASHLPASSFRSCPSSPSPSAKCSPDSSSCIEWHSSSQILGRARHHHSHNHNHHKHHHHQHRHESTIPALSCHRAWHWHSVHFSLLISILITLLSSPTNVTALSSIRISSPDYIFFGDPMWLNCSADLDYTQIYSIKWFKDNQEMYRFITSDEQPTTFYQTSGIVIDENRSNFGNLYIKKTDFKMDANFRCEVLAENDFNTAIEIKKIKVYYIPRDGQPIILGKKTNFRQNELVNLTCTAPMSTPAARLMVTLNGNSITANSNYYQRVYHTTYENGLTTTSVNVQFPSFWLQTRKNDFHCSSSIIHRYNRTASIKFDARSDADNRTAYYLEEHVSLQDNNYIQPRFTRDRLEPKIENFKKKYEVGEVISLRCISAQYKPMPELFWLVDGVPVDAQYLDYKQVDYAQNGFVRLDLKYRLGHNSSPSGASSGLVKKSVQNRTVESYSFRCIQVLSDVISVATEVAELFNFPEIHGNSLDGNSVEAVKSLIGNGAQCRLAFTAHQLVTITIITVFAMVTSTWLSH